MITFIVFDMGRVEVYLPYNDCPGYSTASTPTLNIYVPKLHNS